MKRAIQETAEVTVIWLVMKLMLKLERFQEFKYRAIKRHWKVKQRILDLIEKYLEKNIPSEKKTENCWWSKINIIIW